MKSDTFFAELKRRRVYSVGVAYIVVAWLLIQVATQVFPFFDIPNWVVRLVVVLAIIGFPIAVVCSWAFEITPEGIKLEGDLDRRSTRKTGRKLTALTVIVAALAAGAMAFRLLHSQQGIEAERQPPLREFWKERGYLFGEEFRRYVESDLMKRKPHPDAKPMGAFSISRRPE